MESPVVVDKPPEYGNPNDRGFPFDEEDASGAWSQLASRHPDIAARLRARPHTWARKRRPGSHDGEDDFGDEFAGFDRFPFDDIPPEFREHFPSRWNRRFDHPQQSTTPPPQTKSHNQPQTEPQPSPGPSNPPQQDLPQHGVRDTGADPSHKSQTDSVNADDRNQRSMSAPPDSRTSQPNTNRMSGQSPPHPEQHSSEHSNVRHIPIFVEGRDQPVINKNVDHSAHFGDSKPSFHQSPPPPPSHIDREQYFADDAPSSFHAPNFTRAFGGPFNKGFRQGPQPFVQQKVYPQTAFGRANSPHRSQSPKPQPHQEEHFVKVPVHHEQAPPKPQQKPQPPPQQPPQHQAPPQQHPPQPQPKPQPPPQNDPITQILAIQTDVLNLMTDVENFGGTKKDKQYMYLDEMLTRNLIKLDNIETDGKENIRQARKEAIKCIQKCIAVLEAKAAEKGNNAPQDVEMKEKEGASTEPESAEGKAAENGEVEMKETKEEAPAQPQPSAEGQNQSEPQNAQPEIKEPQPDTRPEAVQETKAKEDDKKTSKKKVGKKQKNKDSEDATKDVNETMQVDDKKVEQNSQAMEVDGAAPSQ